MQSTSRRSPQPKASGTCAAPAWRRRRPASPASTKSISAPSSDRRTHASRVNVRTDSHGSSSFCTAIPVRLGRHRQEGQAHQGQDARRVRGRRQSRPAPPGRARQARAQGNAALQERQEDHVRGHRAVRAPARDDAASRHSDGAVLRHHRQRPRQAVDAEAGARDQGRRRGRHLAARGARASIRCTSTTCS